jgi:hypothetical protein
MDTSQPFGDTSYLNHIPRSQRRRIQKLQAKYVDQFTRFQQREALKAKKPPANSTIDPADIPFMKELPEDANS